MSPSGAFFRKEIKEQLRSGRLLILGAIFVLLGIMNPAIAKLTPWIMESMADSLAASGLTVTEVKITSLDSWTQFFKNIPMGLIAFVLMESAIFTREYSEGTLVLALTKGLSRVSVLAAKTVMLLTVWTACYYLCFFITFAYNVYFWGDKLTRFLLGAAAHWWLFGVWMIALSVLFSVLGRSNLAVLGGDVAAVVISYALDMAPKIQKYMPTELMNGTGLICGVGTPGDFWPASIVALVMIAVCLLASVPIFNRKRL